MQTKTCNKCGEEKALTEFHKMKRGKYGVAGQCKVCRREKGREYRSRPEVQERNREYRRRPEVKKRDRALSMSPKRREYRREYRQRPEVKEKSLEYSKLPHVRERKREYNRDYKAAGIASTRNIEIAAKHATRSGRWSDAEVKFLMSSDLPLVDIALELGRSYQSVKDKRRKARKLLNFEVQSPNPPIG